MHPINIQIILLGAKLCHNQGCHVIYGMLRYDAEFVVFYGNLQYFTVIYGILRYVTSTRKAYFTVIYGNLR